MNHVSYCAPKTHASETHAPETIASKTLFRISNNRPTTQKNLPYISNKYVTQNDLFESLNGKGKILETNQEIDCRLLSTHYLQAAKNGNPRPHELYASITEIENTIGPEVEQQYKALITRGTYHVVPCQSFGRHLADWFGAMHVGEKKVFFLASCNHEMTFDLQIKENGKHVIHFFDPNMTKVTVRCEVDKCTDFDSHLYSLAAFIKPDLYAQYFGGLYNPFAEKECFIVDCTHLSLQPTTQFASWESSSGLNVTGTMLHHAMTNGANVDLCQIDDFGKMRFQDQEIILFSKNAAGIPGRYMALQNGSGEAIRTHGKLLLQVPIENLAKLDLQLIMAAKNPKTARPGRYFAHELGHANALQADRELLLLLLLKLPPEQRIGFNLRELLVAKDPGTGRLALFTSSYHGHADAVLADGSLLVALLRPPLCLLDKSDVLALLATKDRSLGLSALSIAIQRGNAEVVVAFEKIFLEIINIIPEIQYDLAEIVMEVLSGDPSVFEHAIRKNKYDAVEAYIRLLSKFSDQLSSKDNETINVKFAQVAMEMLCGNPSTGTHSVVEDAIENKCYPTLIRYTTLTLHVIDQFSNRDLYNIQTKLHQLGGRMSRSQTILPGAVQLFQELKSSIKMYKDMKFGQSDRLEFLS